MVRGSVFVGVVFLGFATGVAGAFAACAGFEDDAGNCINNESECNVAQNGDGEVKPNMCRKCCNHFHDTTADKVACYRARECDRAARPGNPGGGGIAYD